MDWRIIPSLSSLRAFEATGRLGNQTLASRELNITQAAVAQHMRQLEDALDQPLFVRGRRHFTLTSEGEILYNAVHMAFSSIERGVRDIRSLNNAPDLRITVPPSFYQKWLLRRLPDFWQRYPEVNMKIIVDPNVSNLQEDGFDAALRFGRGDWPEYKVKLFRRRELGIFTARSYIERGLWNPDAPECSDWIIAEDSPDLFSLLSDLKVNKGDVRHRVFENNVEAIAATLGGLGVSLQDVSYLNHEIQYGLVEEVMRLDYQERYGIYWVTVNKVQSRAVSIFEEWLYSFIPPNST